MLESERASESAAAVRGSRMPTLIGIIVRPRATMRGLLESGNTRATVPLAVAAFFSSVLAGSDPREFSDASSAVGAWTAAGIIALILVVCCVVGVVAWLLFSISAVLAGRFLGGTGSFRDVRTAVAWGATPFVLALLYRIPALLFWNDAYRALHGGNQRRLLELNARGLDLTLTGVPDVPLAQIIILGGLDLLLLTVYLFVGSSTLGEAHKVSSWHGLGALLLMLIMPIALLLVVAVSVALAV